VQSFFTGVQKTTKVNKYQICPPLLLIEYTTNSGYSLLYSEAMRLRTKSYVSYVGFLCNETIPLFIVPKLGGAPLIVKHACALTQQFLFVFVNV
jgi:hypothetical protein